MSQTAEQFLDARHGFDARSGQLQGFSYKLTQGQYGLDVALPEFSADSVDEGRMSAWIVFADGTNRDGVGDKLEVGGIRTERHQKNPIVLFDHGQKVQLPVALAEDPETHDYTVVLDPVNQVAKGNAFFYQGKGLSGVDRTDEYDHAVFCEQLFHMIAKRFVRAGSFGYQVLRGEQIPADYRAGIPQGLHLLSTLLLEFSPVVLPANADTVRKVLSDDRMCGKRLSPYLVKSLAPYAPERKAFMAVETKNSLSNSASRGGTGPFPRYELYSNRGKVGLPHDDLREAELDAEKMSIKYGTKVEVNDSGPGGKLEFGSVVAVWDNGKKIKSYATDPLDARDDYDNPLSDATVPPAAFRPGKGAIKELRKKYGRKGMSDGCYDEGFAAFSQGKTAANNPYSGNSRQGQEWLQGFTDAVNQGRRSGKSLSDDVRRIMRGHDVTVEPWGGGTAVIRWNDPSQEKLALRRLEEYGYYSVNGPDPGSVKVTGGGNVHKSLISKPTEIPGVGRVMIHFDTGTREVQVDTDDENRAYVGSVSGGKVRWRKNPYGYETDASITDHVNRWLSVNGKGFRSGSPRNYNRNYRPSAGGSGFANNADLDQQFIERAKDDLDRQGYVGKTSAGRQAAINWLEGEVAKGNLRKVVLHSFFSGVTQNVYLNNKGRLHQLDKIVQEGWKSLPNRRSKGFVEAVLAALGIAGAAAAHRMIASGADKLARWFEGQESSGATPQQAAQKIKQTPAIRSALEEYVAAIEGGSRKSLASEQKSLRNVAAKNGLYVSAFADPASLVNDYAAFASDLVGRFGGAAGASAEIDRLRQAVSSGDLMTRRVLDKLRLAVAKIGQMGKAMKNLRQKYGSKATCSDCGGTGRCVDCGGRGGYNAYGDECSTCSGSGKCQSCMRPKKSLEMRQKYRPVKKLRRRLRKSSPGASTMWIDGKDLDALRKESSEKGLEAVWVGHKNGMDKVRLSGDDAAIDAVAKKFGRTGGWKRLPTSGSKALTFADLSVGAKFEFDPTDERRRGLATGTWRKTDDRSYIEARTPRGSEDDNEINIGDTSVRVIRRKSLPNRGSKAFTPGQTVRFSRSFLGYPARTKVTFVRMLPDDPGMAEVTLSNGHRYAVIEDVLEEIPKDGKSLSNRGSKAFQIGDRVFVVEGSSKIEGVIDNRARDSRGMVYSVILSSGGSYTARENELVSASGGKKSLPNQRSKAGLTAGSRFQFDYQNWVVTEIDQRTGQLTARGDDGDELQFDVDGKGKPIAYAKSLSNQRNKAVLGTKPTQNEVQMRVDALRNGGMEAQDAIDATMAELGLVNLKLSPGGDVIAYEHLGGTSVKALGSEKWELAYHVPGKGGWKRKEFKTEAERSRFIEKLTEKEGDDVEFQYRDPEGKSIVSRKSLPAMTEAQLVEALKEQQKAMRLLNEGVTGAMLHVMDL